MKQATSTVEKAIQLLLTLSDEGHEIGTTDLGRKLGIHKATVSRILLKLAEYKFVYKNKETRKYGLGAGIHQLAMNMADDNFNDVMKVAVPHLKALRDEIQETVTLEIWLGNSTVPTYCALPDNPLKVIPPPGEPLPLYAAAGAKAILSYTHIDRADVLLKGKHKKLTENTMIDNDLILKRLKEYNKQGYSTDFEEVHKGICAVAAPLFDRLRQPIAAIVILMPVSRSAQIDNPALIRKLKRKTSAISNQLSMSRV